MASQINHNITGPMWKPLKQKKANPQAAWLKLRKQVLDGRELWGGWFNCDRCTGKFKRHDIELHHIIKRSQSKADILNENNLMAVCNACHRALENR